MLYDLTELNFYVSYGYMDDDGKNKKNAYERPYIKFDGKALFNEPRPKKLME